jgi:alpha/beta superfamily hydrolase
MKKVQERPIIFHSGALVLEGLYHKGSASPGIVIGAPHPRFGGSMDSPVVAEVAFAAARKRHPTIRFNYRGVGGSNGARGGDFEEIDDFKAAMAELRVTTGFEEIVSAGYSYGSRLALDVALSEEGVCGAILVAPPTRDFDFADLRKLRVPTLIVAGTGDDHLDLAVLRDLLTGVPAAQLAEIPEAGHFFERGLVALGRRIDTFMASLAPD